MEDDNRKLRDNESESANRGCRTGLAVLIAAPIGALLGGGAGVLWGLKRAEGVDAIFPPVLWSTPLGAFAGAILLASLAAGYFASRR